MTPKENAIYLIHLFNRGGYGKINARIHVEEILSINSVDKDEDLSNYWEQVKQEIEKTMTNNKQQTAVKLYTEEQLLNTADAIRDYLKNYPEKFHESMIKKHLTALAPIATKRTLIIYNTKETMEEEARHLLEILNCDDSTLWDNADHCGVQVIEVPLDYGGDNE